MKKRGVNDFGNLQNRRVQRVLDDHGTKALVEAEQALLLPHGADAVSHALVLRVNREHLVPQVCVVDDRAGALHVQAVQNRLQRVQRDVRAEAGHEVGDELRKVGVQHALHRAGALAEVAVVSLSLQDEQDDLLDDRADDVMENPVQHRGEDQGQERKQALAVRHAQADHSSNPLPDTLQNPGAISDYLTLYCFN